MSNSTFTKPLACTVRDSTGNNLTFHIKFDQPGVINKNIVDQLIALIQKTGGLSGYLEHSLVEGRQIEFPTRLVRFSDNQIGKVEKGRVFFYPPQQKIVIAYDNDYYDSGLSGVPSGNYKLIIGYVGSEEYSILSTIGNMLARSRMLDFSRKQILMQISLT